MELCQVQNSLCVQVLRSPILATLLHGARAVGVIRLKTHLLVSPRILDSSDMAHAATNSELTTLWQDRNVNITNHYECVSNHATGYASKHIWSLFQATINWECCGRKGIQHKNGGWSWALISPDGVAPRWMVGVSASVSLPLHHKVQRKISSGTGLSGWSRKRAI